MYISEFFIGDEATTWSLNIRQQRDNDETEIRYLLSEIPKPGCWNNKIKIFIYVYTTARIAQTVYRLDYGLDEQGITV
jgi:hypothetical protein